MANKIKIEGMKSRVDLASESDVVEFLKFHNFKSTLDEVTKGLGIKKYGSGSAFVLLQKLKNKGIVEREGNNWVLVKRGKVKLGPEEAVKPEEKAENVQKLMKSLVKGLTTAVTEVKKPTDEWEVAQKPFERETTVEVEKEIRELIARPSLEVSAMKKLKGFTTGTFLDELFLDDKGDSIGGIPACGQFAVTGLPGAGKSLLVIEIALKVANDGRKVLFVTSEDTWASETERFDLQSRFMDKAKILHLDWKKIAKNLFIMDTVSYPELREWEKFVETYRYVAGKEKIDLVIIDSVTILEAYRGALKYRAMELGRYNQVHGITALFVNQRASDRWDVHDMAGGIGLAHNLDGTIIVDYGHVYFTDQQRDLGLKRGEFTRIARVLDCRLCNFLSKRIPIKIAEGGFIRSIERIAGS